MGKRVLVVDDSSLVREHLEKLFSEQGYEVDTASNGKEAVELALTYQYSAITMDISMPVMDGLEAIKFIMEKRPTPILVVSSLTVEGAQETIESLALGAVDYTTKPGQYSINISNQGEEILHKLEAVSNISTQKISSYISKLQQTKKIVPPKQTEINLDTSFVNKVVLVGASTGGPGLIEQICVSLPANYPYPVCVVQHMPEQFTTSFAARLNNLSSITVKESEHGEELRNGVVYIAKGGSHLHLKKAVSGKYVIKHGVSQKERFFAPSVDEMYLSAIEVFDAKDIHPYLLTGIGDDGAEGMVRIKSKGGFTVGESEESCTIYGMPRVAYESGGISEQMDFDSILKHILSLDGVR